MTLFPLYFIASGWMSAVLFLILIRRQDKTLATQRAVMAVQDETIRQQRAALEGQQRLNQAIQHASCERTDAYRQALAVEMSRRQIVVLGHCSEAVN